MKFNQQIKPITLLLSAIFAQHAAASGYNFGTQSVNSQSTANSSAAESESATNLFANPAGLAHLEDNEISATATVVMPTIEYSNTKAEYFQGGEVKGTGEGKITSDLFTAPHAYGAYKLNDHTTLGLGVYVPFASETEYDKNSKLRYNINQLGIKSVAIEPAISFKLSDKHSFGVGVVAQYSKAKLRKFSDWSAAYSDAQLAGLKAKGMLPTTDRSAFAGHADVGGDDWGVGYHLGALYEPNERVRIGTSYRSPIKHNLRGTAEWHADGAVAKATYPTSIGKPISLLPDGSVNPLGGKGYLKTEGANVKIITPESASVHGMYKATDKLNLFGDVTWTRHSRFNEANLVFENKKATVSGKPSQTTNIKPNWRNTFKVAIGGSYQLSNPLQIRAGIAFDQSPVRSLESRLNTLPDGNRVWYSAGLKYHFAKGHTLDVAYSHIHVNNTRFEGKRATGKDIDSKGVTSADFNNYANIVGVQYTYKF